MTIIEYNKFPAVQPDGTSMKVTIASGPVIIRNGKVLLDKHEDPFWKFPGGRLRDDNAPQVNAVREAREEVGLDVTLTSEPFVISFEREKDGVKEFVILIHYLATAVGEVVPGNDVTEWAWHDIENLPADCAPNVVLAIKHFQTK